MTNLLNFEKLLALPTTFTPGTVYVVQNQSDSRYIDIFVSNSTGSDVKKIFGLEDVNTSITEALTHSNLTNVIIVEDINSRNALGAIKPTFVLVKDATGDSTVLSGSASYVWDPNTQSWIKLSEFESLDISFEWDSLKNKPNRTPFQIDSAVDKSHSHGNTDLLDAFSEDNNQNLLFRGKHVSSSAPVWEKEEW